MNRAAGKRDFLGYGLSRPEMAWPDGKRVALSIVINYEEGADGPTLRDGASGDDLGEFLGFRSGDTGGRDRTMESFFEFGSRVGIWRLLDILDRADARASIFACAQALEKNAPVAMKLVDAHHEICYHGYRWESHDGLSRDEELALFQLALESYQATTGQRPVGCFVTKGLTANTRSLLVELGFEYDSNSYADELPYYVDVDGKPHTVIPYSAETNDIRYWTTSGFISGKHYADVLTRTIDRHRSEAGQRPSMMTVGLHPRISGRPERAAGLEAFLEHARSCPEVWIATRAEICRWWQNMIAPEDGLWHGDGDSRPASVDGIRENQA